MVRTKANTGCGARVSVEKAPRKNFGGSSSSFDLGSPSSKKDKFAGGNPVCKRPTPEWQKPISKFFMPRMGDKENEESGSPPKRRQISDEEKENEIPKESATSSSSASAGSSKSSAEPATEKPGSSAAGSSSANGCVVSVNDEISEDD